MTPRKDILTCFGRLFKTGICALLQILLGRIRVDIALLRCLPTKYIVAAYHGSSDALELTRICIDTVINQFLDSNLLHLNIFKALLLIQGHQPENGVPLIGHDRLFKLLQKLINVFTIMITFYFLSLILKILNYLQINFFDLRLAIILSVKILGDHLSL
jgi:hypothetical protein